MVTLPSGSPLLAPGALTSRDDVLRLADRLLGAVRPFASDGHGRITPPGRAGGYGRAVDGLEGFARTFLLAGFRLAGQRGDDPTNLAEWYAQGLDSGSSPTAPDRWVRLPEHGQAKVEAASLALVLDLTRPWIWDRLAPRVQEQLVDYLAPAVGDDTYPRINWVWFRLVVQTFLRSVGGPFDLGEMQADLDTHDSFVRADGWLADGAERAYDHYVGWALHLYPTLWARMAGAGDLAAPRHARDVAALDRFLLDALALVGGDGGPLVQGRSLVYRFAAAAPFWVGAMADVPSTAPGALRTAALGVVDHFVRPGAPDERGLLTLGWFGEWPALAQSYSGPGSPYWASKGLLGLALPADHPVWTAPAEELPVQRADVLRAVRAPGWLVSGTTADGVVRVVNHGTDHAVEGAQVGDSPLYARLGYSTVTSPLLDERAWREPLDQSVVLCDAAGRATHRAGMRTLAVEVTEDEVPVGYGASVSATHWLDPETGHPQHGSGYAGSSTPAGRVAVHSLVRGPWEVRFVELDEVAPSAVELRLGGWPVAGDEPAGSVRGTAAVATADGIVSQIEPLLGEASPHVRRLEDASPLGHVALVPWLALRPVPAEPVAVLVTLDGSQPQQAPPAHPRLVVLDDPVSSTATGEGRSGRGTQLEVTWPDGARTRTRLISTTTGPADPVR